MWLVHRTDNLTTFMKLIV